MAYEKSNPALSSSSLSLSALWLLHLLLLLLNNDDCFTGCPVCSCQLDAATRCSNMSEHFVAMAANAARAAQRHF